MRDPLENFVRQNREQFDDRAPSPGVWRGIETSLNLREPSLKKPLIWWRAAAIFFMALSAYLLIPGQGGDSETAQAMKEFADVESFYIQQISNKVELIAEFSGDEELDGFTHDFQQLEAMYQVLKEQMKTRPSQQVKDALVLNLLVRIDLLNQQLHRLEKEQAVEVDKKSSEGERST
jgi:hypothetical protein